MKEITIGIGEVVRLEVFPISADGKHGAAALSDIHILAATRAAVTVVVDPNTPNVAIITGRTVGGTIILATALATEPNSETESLSYEMGITVTNPGPSPNSIALDTLIS